MNRIKYICYYDLPDADVERKFVPSASNKLNYVWSVLNRSGYGVDVISACCSEGKKLHYCKGQVLPLGEANTLRLFPSFSGPKVIRVLGRYYLWLCFFCWLLFHVKRNEKIIVYHSLGYAKLLSVFQRIKKCQYIGEIEEVYQDVSPMGQAACRAEYQFIDRCCSFIFPTHLLNQKLNAKGKPYVLVHGIYTVEPSRHVRWEDDDIHVVYAGTFDPNKGGAVAVAAAAYLPKGYHLHICGFGTEADKAALIKAIEETNAQSGAAVTFEGLLKGEAFTSFLQKCQIGLCTQNPDAAFNATSFPSKVLTYLANGLHVVSIRIPAVEQSGVGHCLCYYDEQTPQMIAAAIQRAGKETLPDPVATLRRLDVQFERDLSTVLSA